MQPYKELLSLADHLASLDEYDVLTAAEGDLNALLKVTSRASRAFSGSWQGYHANVYYSDLATPPPGAHFSQEWGLQDVFGLGSVGDWCEFDPDQVIMSLKREAGNPDLTAVRNAASAAEQEFEEAKTTIISVIHSVPTIEKDAYLGTLEKEIEGLTPMSVQEVISSLAPKGQIITRDTITLGQGVQIPPHIAVEADVRAIHHAFGICRRASFIARKTGSHLERKERSAVAKERIGTNVFIGHGQSSEWRELKDFVQDRLHLPWDEFNRVPVAGVTNQARLKEMLDAASIALVVMTAEDETKEGSVQARMNVIHEVGLFQGRLGFTRAIVLLEEGCKQFSNIEGLGQIRFPRGKIRACFEEVRSVLEREGMIET
jgi:hypothetical protein